MLSVVDERGEKDWLLWSLSFRWKQSSAKHHHASYQISTYAWRYVKEQLWSGLHCTGAVWPSDEAVESPHASLFADETASIILSVGEFGLRGDSILPGIVVESSERIKQSIHASTPAESFSARMSRQLSLYEFNISTPKSSSPRSVANKVFEARGGLTRRGCAPSSFFLSRSLVFENQRCLRESTLFVQLSTFKTYLSLPAYILTCLLTPLKII